MESVGMKLLREDLAAYVARARAGERIIITDRGQDVAELSPLSPEARLIRRLVSEGSARWSGQRPALRVPDVTTDGSAVSDAIIEDRRDSVP